MKYCCDSNILITANNTYYPIDVFPVFWDWLIANQVKVGTISWVHRELMDKVGGDNLSTWATANKKSGFFRFDDHDDDVQICFGEIANYVGNLDKPAEQKAFFLSKADPWLIAYSAVNKCKLVTLENLVAENARRIAIPNVCNAFGVEYLNTFAMLKAESAFFRASV